MSIARPQAVLDFWFGPQADGFSDAFHRGRWYAFDPAFDQEIVSSFGATLAAAARGELGDWLQTPATCLAYILVTDQFSRQIHRRTANAFATDTRALDAARVGISQGWDRTLGYDERAFFYLPFEHSEELIDQHTAVGLFTQLRDETPQPHRHQTGEYLRHAHQHRDIVQRFGRFPHRNALIGRTSTPAELTHLESAGGFGQSTQDD